MNILLIGPQASGKGTQAEKLVEKYSLAHIEMGKLLRSVEKEDSDLGRKVAEMMQNGILVTDEIVIEVMNKYLQSINRLDGILFDGFPRVLSQAEYFEKFLEEKGKKIDLVIYLVLPREETFKRIANRRICEKCGKVFNLVTNPPRVEGVCDYCSGQLIIRNDETPEKINIRLDQFEKQTKPLVDFYQKKGIVEEVDGNRPIDVIFEDIVSRIKNRNLA